MEANCPIYRNNLILGCIICEDLPAEKKIPCSSIRCYWSTAHAYHKHCIDRWLKVHSVCPIDNHNWKELPETGLSLKELCLRSISGNTKLIFEFYFRFCESEKIIPKGQIELLAKLASHPGRAYRDTNSIPAPFREMLMAPFLNYLPKWKKDEIGAKAIRLAASKSK